MAGKNKHLTLSDRRKIEGWFKAGERPCDIAAFLDVHTATIYRELQRGETGSGYNAVLANQVVMENKKRKPKKTVVHK